ncbi:hypothetical protein SCHIN_v1c04650 [Spiroplasma chinense]|uniref:Uncharacterized protein n=1 Tax=Spiroplasma chinense TaxID=216932 RepID=A0A5B9Y6F9_9MOLU|nr:hypothetical protein [Spiroplasma chinense]QEH61662.1 hypothetical protein SCHIN_v1c04650 [Spiroplasma chinense]
MSSMYEVLSSLLKDLLPADSNYVFKQIRETDEEIKFILVIDEKLENNFSYKKTTIAELLTSIINDEQSVFTKKANIEVEVYDGSE